MNTKSIRRFTVVLGASVVCSSTAAIAFERGFPGSGQVQGIFAIATAGVPPPGIYMFNSFQDYQAHIVGPGAPSVGGAPTKVQVASQGDGVLFVPGWTFLGATYDAVMVQVFVQSSAGAPFNSQAFGLRNTYVVPAELSWKLGDSGFYVKTGLGFQVPTGTVKGPAGLDSIGNPWWIVQPELLVSYLKDGWTVSANFALEINTHNTITKYQTGDVLHAEFQATKTIGKWTVGPVGYYMGQVTNDTSSAFYNYAINVNRYNVWAAGLLVGYDFGPLQLKLWAYDQFHVDASGGTPRFPDGSDSASFATGWKVFAALSYRLWAPDDPALAPAKLIYK